MVSNKFQSAFGYILSKEGGYSNNPLDRGGITNYGIAYNYQAENLKKYGITFLTQPHTTFENAQLKLLFTFLFVGKCSNLDYYNTAVLKTLQKNHFLFQQRTANRTLLFNDIKTSMVSIDEYLLEE